MSRNVLSTIVFLSILAGCTTPSGTEIKQVRDLASRDVRRRKPDAARLKSVKGNLSRRNQVRGRPGYTVDPSLLQAQQCERSQPGSLLPAPATLVSAHGVLEVTFDFNTDIGEDGTQRFCYVTPDGNQSPTLHVRPGDHLILTVNNRTPAPVSTNSMVMSTNANDICGNATEDDSSTNIHFHGTNTRPVCHQDQVIHTLINHGESFTYDLAIPSNEAPGLYWYHPHVHGDSERQVHGGAAGALVIDGIESQVPELAGLTERIMVIRDNLVPGLPVPGGPVPSWDLSVNYVPIPYPDYPTPIVQMLPNRKQFWRVVNASADTILNLQLQYDGVPQPLKVVALDGIALNSQNGTRTGRPQVATSILLGTAARAEFVVKAPSKRVKKAQLVTLPIETGPSGDNDPLRALVSIQTTDKAEIPPFVLDAVPSKPWRQPFEDLARQKVTAKRHVYFSEAPANPNDPSSLTNFFITVLGQTPKVFNMNEPPAVITTQGAVEDWTIENMSPEMHVFHIHQIHFMLLEVNGIPVRPAQRQFYDIYPVPFCTNPNAVPGTGQCPSIKVRMDFRGNIAGDFVFHCHILGHEDSGMMAIIRVLPPPQRRSEERDDASEKTEE